MKYIIVIGGCWNGCPVVSVKTDILPETINDVLDLFITQKDYNPVIYGYFISEMRKKIGIKTVKEMYMQTAKEIWPDYNRYYLSATGDISEELMVSEK